MPAPTIFNVATGQLCHAADITDPTGGGTVDAEARTATDSILSALRSAAVIAGATALNVSQAFNGPTAQVVQGAAITAPTGGATQDAEVRTAIDSILAVLQNAGKIAGATTTIFTHALDEDDGLALKVGAAIADASGGVTVDAECRTAINDALAAMRLSGLLAND